MSDLDLSWITDDLAIGGAFPPAAIPVLAAEHGIRAIVDLRATQCDDRAILAHHGIELLHLPTPDHEPISATHLVRGTEFLAAHATIHSRALVHCQYGIGRSVLLVLCALVDRGMEPLAALALAKQRRSRLSPSLAQYLAWTKWLVGCGHASPSFEEFSRVAHTKVA